MMHYTTEPLFDLQAAFIISARRAGRAAGEAAGAKGAFVKYLDAAYALKPPSGSAPGGADRIEEDAERWDGMS